MQLMSDSHPAGDDLCLMFNFSLIVYHLKIMQKSATKFRRAPLTLSILLFSMYACFLNIYM